MPTSPRDLPIWALATTSLRAGTPVALLCVLRSAGSSPGRQGFKMAVTAAAVAGSIGGGIMEHKWVELARQRLRAADATPLLRPQIHRREAPADRSGMMCSGEQDVLLWPLTAADLPTTEAIEQALLTNAGRHLGTGCQRPVPPDYDRSGNRFSSAVLRLPVRPRLALPRAAGLPRPPHDCGWRARQPGPVTGSGGPRFRADRPRRPPRPAHPRRQRGRPTTAASSTTKNVAAEVPTGPHQYVVVMTVGYRTDRHSAAPTCCPAPTATSA